MKLKIHQSEDQEPNAKDLTRGTSLINFKKSQEASKDRLMVKLGLNKTEITKHLASQSSNNHHRTEKYPQVECSPMKIKANQSMKMFILNLILLMKKRKNLSNMKRENDQK